MTKRDTVTELPLYLKAARAFARVPDVLGVGVGFKETAGRLTSTVALRVTVRHKLPRQRLSVRELIPSTFCGWPTDVCEPLSSYAIGERLIGGTEISSRRAMVGAAGTLGCLAQRSGSSDRFVLTAGHVLFDELGTIEPGGEVGAPDVSCCWVCATGVIGEVAEGRIDDRFDVGLVRLNGRRVAVQRIPGLGKDANGHNADMIMGVAPLREMQGGVRSPLALGEHVRKVGATTGLTGGTVVGLEVSLPPDGELPALSGQIVIRPLQDEGSEKDGKVDFCRTGDSGAVVVNDNNEVAALLVRAPIFTTEPPWVGLGGGATNLHQILGALNVTIPRSYEPRATRPTSALVSGGRLVRPPRLTEPERAGRLVLEAIREELRRFPLGRRLVDAIERHRPEIGHLVNHQRRVTVAWHRAHGPAFLALFLRELRSVDQPMPHTVNGAPITQGLVAMRRALEENGSPELVADLQQLWPALSAVVPGSRTLRHFVDNLRLVENHG